MERPEVEPPAARPAALAKLSFRLAAGREDLEALARTEIYGDRRTNVDQVVEWWAAFPRGNLVAVYVGAIVGGVDIWPLTPACYHDLLAGRITEEALTSRQFALAGSPQGGSFWYVGSVSLALQLPPRLRRQALLLLLVHAMRHWQGLFRHYPVHIGAESWTRVGRNLLARLGFTPGARRGEGPDADTLFELRLGGEPELVRLRQVLERRLARG
jgi:hypothetical protein